MSGPSPSASGERRLQWSAEQAHAARAQARRAGDRAAELEAAEHLAHRLYMHGEHAAALEAALDAVPVAIGLGDAVGEARARIAASSCLFEMGMLEQSVEQVHRAICLLEHRPEPVLLARAFSNAGRSAAALRQFDDAVKFARASYRCAREHVPLAPMFLVNLAGHYDTAGRYRRAFRLARIALRDVRRRQLAPRWQGIALACMGMAALNQGRLDAAEEALREARITFRAGGDRRERCEVLVAWARLRLAQRRPLGVARLLRAVMRAAASISVYKAVEEARAVLAQMQAAADAAAAATLVREPPQAAQPVTPELKLLLARVEIVIERGESRRLRRRAVQLAVALRAQRRSASLDAARDLIFAPTLLQRAGPATLPGSRSAQALTQRELDVARVLMSGATNKQIAQALGLAAGTVRNHLSSVMAKLRAATRGELIATLHRQLDVGVPSAGAPPPRGVRDEH